MVNNFFNIINQNTQKAIDAIQNKNESALNQVLIETNSLHNQIQKLKEDGVLAIIDLNYFKIVNDTYGHSIGDKVLIFIANQLKKVQKSVVRYGGDEFIIIFDKGTKEQTAISKLNNIRDNILKKSMKVKDASFKISFSIGVKEFKIGDSLNKVIELADQNMYHDKIEIKRRVTSI